MSRERFLTRPPRKDAVIMIGMATANPTWVVTIRFRYSACHQSGITGTVCGDNLEGIDHAGNGSKQAKQRSNRCQHL